jgi:mono/diheme cytochrome c family protein
MASVKGLSIPWIVLPFALFAGIGLSPGVSHAAAVGARDQATHGDEPPRGPFITRVEGPSNFHRLSIPIEESAMGRTGLLGPPPGLQAVTPPAAAYSEDMTRPVTLTGADLYRLGCQSCHRADGSGAPPEINALIGPVQATSATLMERRMKERGRPISATFARELAAGSLKDLRDRLKNGGRKMPSFAYLTDREAEALIGYLDRLAGMPGPAKELAVTEPGARVGELLVKGTCHICHDATGLWPSTEDLLQGAVPPLARFAAEKTVLEVVRKVRHGAPVTMGIVPFPYRGRMPVFDYLSDDEVVSAYLYLMTYPPLSAGSLRPPPN